MENEELQTFNFKELIGDIEHDYRVTMSEYHYEVEKDGLLIAELQHNEDWQQISGDPLQTEVIDAIVDKIERYFC